MSERTIAMDVEFGERVYVTDPCYDVDSPGLQLREDRNNLFGEIDIAPGKYWVVAHISDCGVWGERVTTLTAQKVDEDVIVRQFAPFDVAVDSGQAGIFDVEKFNYGGNATEKFYDDCCEATNNTVGKVGEGCVVSTSGYGDGVYECILGYNDNKEVVYIMIVFVGEEEYDEYNDDEDDWDDESDDEFYN